MANILVVDSDQSIRAQIEQALNQDGHKLTNVSTAKLAIREISTRLPDLIILDAAQDHILDLCTRVRSTPTTAQLPILCLSADLSPAEALNIGTDDFIHKPFMGMELAARVRVLSRWAQRQGQRRPTAAPTLKFEKNHATVQVDDKAVNLTHTEYKLLALLAKHPGEYLSIAILLRQVWNYPNDPTGSALVRNHICNLRGKVERDPKRPSMILSQHGRGYSLSPEVTINS